MEKRWNYHHYYIMEMYGEHHTKVWILLWECMDIIMGMYGEYHINVWILLWECKDNIMQMYGEH